MHPVKEKLSNMASAAKEHADIARAKAEEKLKTATATATTPEERERAHERTKAKEAEAKMEFHEKKAERLDDKQQYSHIHGQHYQHQHGEHEYPIPTPGGEYPTTGRTTTTGAAPTTGTTVPTRPVAGQPPTTKYL